MKRKKILLAHLNSNGDCLFATVIARQIKEVDYPNCHLTWAVNSKCKQAVLLNPLIDEIWEIPTESSVVNFEEWTQFISQVKQRKSDGDFDETFVTQIYADNWMNYDGGIRSSTYNNYPHEITVSHTPVIELSEAEVANVKRFAERHEIGKFERVILIECGPDSFDVALNTQSALKLANELTVESEKTAIILSSNKQIVSPYPNVIDGSELSFRENAELTKYCDLFVGCGSGISWLATTNWAKKLKMVLIISQTHLVLPSMVYDHEYIGLPTDHIIELKSNEDSMAKLRACLGEIALNGFDSARTEFHEKIELVSYQYLDGQLDRTFTERNLKPFYKCLRNSVKRNGLKFLFTKQFKQIIARIQSVTTNKLLKVLRLKRTTLANQRK